jgi:CYTH domain-containing protein
MTIGTTSKRDYTLGEESVRINWDDPLWSERSSYRLNICSKSTRKITFELVHHRSDIFRHLFDYDPAEYEIDVEQAEDDGEGTIWCDLDMNEDELIDYDDWKQSR